MDQPHQKQFQKTVPTQDTLEFDWIFYVSSHSDLLQANINTYDMAIDHYTKYGYREGRLCSLPTSNLNKYYLVNLTIGACRGLCNQFWALLNALMIGRYTGRNIVVSGFYPDYRGPNSVPLSKIININELNNTLNSLKFNISVLDPVDYQWVQSPNKGILSRLLSQPNCLIRAISILRQESNPYIDIGNTFTASLKAIYSDKYSWNLLTSLLCQIKFVPEIYDVVNYCKKFLKIDSIPYCAIHLRIENDMINHIVNDRPQNRGRITQQYYCNSIKARYLKSMEKSFTRNNVIYLATYLLRSENINNSFVYDISRLYPNIKFWESKNYWRNQFPTLINGREIDAIIDYLLCVDSDLFIGYDGSTFSETITYVLDSKGKHYDKVVS